MTRSSLFLCHRLPFPPNKGDKIRSYALLRHLAQRGPVHLACFVDEAEDLQYLDKVREMAGGNCYFERLGAGAKAWRSLVGLATGKPLTTACFGSARLQAWVDQTLRGLPIDDVVVFGSAMAPYLLRAPTAPERVLFDMVDIDSDKWRQYAARSRGGVKWLYGREAEKLEALECLAADAFGHTLLASDFEAETFKTIAPASAGKITGLTNGVDLEQFSPGNFANPFGTDEVPIVMTGRMDYRPNHEGALWFAREVFPQVLKFIPNATVHFVGSGPPAGLREAAGPGVVVTGAVPDVRPYIQFAQAVIAPLHIARGVQNKVLEAMAMAKPVVATHDATRSLGVQAGHHLWVEKEPRRFANAVVEALQGPDRDKLARNARGYVEVHHSWPRLMQDFEHHLELLRPDPRGNPAAARAAASQKLELSAPCKS
ncbi:MAG: TIGR03087 family PEP-CTERM/XrtA system glycosyltransferase [Rhizomicrobium sp.]